MSTPIKDYYCFSADKTVIGAKIKECRQKLKLTADDLADKLMYTTKNINKWEQGKGLPRPETIVDLCNLFQISQDDLLLPKSKYPYDYHFLYENKDSSQTPVGDFFIFSYLYSPEIKVNGEEITSPHNCFKEMEDHQRKLNFDEAINTLDEYKDFSFVFGRLDYLSQKFVFSWLDDVEDIEFSNYLYFVISPSNYLRKLYGLEKNTSHTAIKQSMRAYFNDKYGTDYKSKIESLNKDELMFEFYKLISKQYGKRDFFNINDWRSVDAAAKIPLYISCEELKEHISTFVKYLNQLEKDTLYTALQSFEKDTYLSLKEELEKNDAFLIKPLINKTILKKNDFVSFEKIYENILEKISDCSYEEYLDMRIKGGTR